ncbi:ORF7b protein [Bat SARS-like coronavirus Khosta-2]|nr:ORF7b protein [Bat SARS-like coronavirus Khosta-2]
MVVSLTSLDFYLCALAFLFFLVIIMLIIFCFVLELQDLNELK